MKNYLKEFENKGKKKLQMGGNTPAPAAAPQEGAPDVEGMIMQAFETQDPEMALAAVNAIVEAMGGGGQAAPAPAPQEGTPMGRYGMKVPKVSLK